MTTQLDDAAARLRELGYEQELARRLSLRDLVIHGLIYMVPLAPIGVFGIIYNISSGAVAAVYVVAAVAMLFSAISYKEMAQEFPISGSTYSYVSLGTNRFLGFVSGWAILLDYLLLPALLCVLSASAMTSIVHAVPAWTWVVLFVAVTTVTNFCGVDVAAKLNKSFLYIQLAILAVFLCWAAILVLQGHAHLTLDPFHPYGTASWSVVAGAIPVAAFSFLGFDAVSTLNEEAKGGGKAVSKATMLVMYLSTMLFVVQVYVACILVPSGTHFADGTAANNAFYDLVGGVMDSRFKLIVVLNSALIAAMGNIIAANATASRLVYSMARDGHLPRMFARVSGKHRVPVNAMVMISGLALAIGIFGVSQASLLTTLVTFGALLSYILMHFSVVNHFANRSGSRRWFIHVVSPLLGATILTVALWDANTNAKIVGVAWLALGIGIGAYLRWTGRSLKVSAM
ncbi:amino acid transporter [Mycobacteriaceae bacterium 1482268.1]|nr:amino acid transporter [Mycobacteriaceae bacterium 1482268.1]